MAQFTNHPLHDDVAQRLKARETEHGLSLQEEVCNRLRTAVNARPERTQAGLGSKMAARFAAQGLADNESLAKSPTTAVRPPNVG